LIGGSPCQGFSFAGKQLNFNDPRSKLFFEFVDILNHIKNHNPNVKFLLENVGMKKQYEDVISDRLGCKPICIDSEVITPMRRKRLYWFNFDAIDLAQRPCCLKDILEIGVNPKYFKNEQQFNKITYTENGTLYIRNLPNKKIPVQEYDGVILSRTWQTYMPLVKQKSHAIRSANPDDVGVCVRTNDGLRFRKFTLSEMEKMQTLPVGYTKVDGVSERQSKSTIGNGWTVDVIAHILKALV
jgi:site-specific DNA-cytosine methylase